MTYCISDLHGIPVAELEALLAKADFGKKDFLYILGDLIDRGECGVALLLWAMEQENVEFLLGNHELMMMECDFLFDKVTDKTVGQFSDAEINAFSHWMRNGGEPTVKGLQALPKAKRADVLDFLRCAPIYETVSAGGRDYILCHAGLGDFAPDKRLADYDPYNLLWYRPCVEERWYEDIITVFGHTPTALYGSKYRGKILQTDTFINIDTTPVKTLLRLEDVKTFSFG